MVHATRKMLEENKDKLEGNRGRHQCRHRQSRKRQRKDDVTKEEIDDALKGLETAAQNWQARLKASAQQPQGTPEAAAGGAAPEAAGAADANEPKDADFEVVDDDNDKK